MTCQVCRFELLRAVLTSFFAEADGNAGKADAVKISEAIGRLLLEKEGEGLTPAYRRSLRQLLNRFSQEIGPETDLVTLDARRIEAWLRTRTESPSTRAANLGRLSSLFEWATRQGHVSENPIRRIRPPKLRPAPPRILSPSEAEHLLASVRVDCPEILGFVVLGLFAGVRPFEVLDIPWAAVDLDCGRLRVDRTKTGRRRVAHLEPAAVEWLRVCPRSGDMVAPSWSTVRRRRRAIMPDWPQDILRHTAASYLLELHQDAGRVSLWLGNSARILLRHYHELVSPEDCRRFWGLRP